MRDVISALSDTVAIVDIPVSLCGEYTTQLYWTVGRAASESEEFFNVTSNRIEVGTRFRLPSSQPEDRFIVERY